VVYPSARDYSAYRRFLNTLRVVTNIPELKMVASFTAQAIWYDWSRSFKADETPIGWIGYDLVQHTITPDMLNGYLDMNGNYSATKPEGASMLISDLANSYTDSNPSKSPVTWNMMARLTKQLGRFGGLSFYVNNSLYYEPYSRATTPRRSRSATPAASASVPSSLSTCSREGTMACGQGAGCGIQPPIHIR
jgi:hypothetical protein